MATNQQMLEEDEKNEFGSERNTISSTDEFAGVSALASGGLEVMVIQMIRRAMEPVFESVVRRVVKEEIGLELQKQLASMNPKKSADTSVPKKLKLQFRNKIALPVYTGTELLGENHTPIEVVLLDGLTEKIVNTGTESTTKVEIVVLQEGSDDDEVSWTLEEFQNKIVSERKGKKILRGNTYIKLKEGVGFVGDISFTHNSDWTKNGKYRLGARVVDAVLMTRVEGARTESFLIKDRRNTLYEKRHPPSLSDKVYHLEQISYNGARHKSLKGENIETVKEFLALLLTNQKRLEDILKLKASTKIWEEIVNHAHTCVQMFLYPDQRTGVVFNVKQQLKGLFVESQYIPVDQLSDKQKEEAQKSVMSASEHLKLLDFFEDEASIMKKIQPDIILKSLISPCSNVTNSSPDLIEAPDNSDNSIFDMDQSLDQGTMVASQLERGKEKVPCDGEMSYHYTNCYRPEPPIHSLHPISPESQNYHNAYDPTHPGTSTRFILSANIYEGINSFNNSDQTRIRNADFDFLSESPDRPIHTPDLRYEYEYELSQHLNWGPYIQSETPNYHHSETANSDTDVLIVAAPTGWTKLSKLLRRVSIRERIGIHVHKKQRCC